MIRSATISTETVEPIARDCAIEVQTHEQLSPVVSASVKQFIHRHGSTGGASIEHDPRWLNVFSNSLGQRTFALFARHASETREGAIRGYLPLAFVSTRLLGKYLVSLPYLNRAGVVADDDVSATLLVDHAIDLANELDAQYLELRHAESMLNHDQLDATRDEKVRMEMALPADHDFLWKTLTSKVRNQIRKGEKNDLQIDCGGNELLDSFYNVFAINMRDLGTPVYPRSLFEQILDAFNDEAELVVVRCQDKAIAGALLLHDPHDRGGVTQVPSASCLRAFNHTNANMWMYFHLLKRAIDRGSRFFDFGRSSVDSGTYRFKKQWGAVASPTVWQYHTRHGDISDVRPDNPKFKRRIELWKRMPLWASRWLGPRIVRGIP